MSASTPCQPWCTEHANGTPAHRAPLAEDQLCMNRVTSPAFGEVLASYSADDGPMISLYRTKDDLTLAEAEQLAHAIIAQVATAQGRAMQQIVGVA